MHAHERTYLAKLGFSDPDLRLPMHDLACQYLTTEPVLERLARFLEIEHGPKPYCFKTESNDGEFEQESQVSRSLDLCYTQLECEIPKGHDQYRTTVGFVDVCVKFSTKEQHTNVRRRQLHARGRDYSPDWKSIENFTRRGKSFVNCIEVKITPVTICEIIRQINFYKSYSRFSSWIVATTYPISVADLKCLSDENLRHIYLGQNFQAYLAEQENKKPAESAEI